MSSYLITSQVQNCFFCIEIFLKNSSPHMGINFDRQCVGKYGLIRLFLCRFVSPFLMRKILNRNKILKGFNTKPNLNPPDFASSWVQRRGWKPGFCLGCPYVNSPNLSHFLLRNDYSFCKEYITDNSDQKKLFSAKRRDKSLSAPGFPQQTRLFSHLWLRKRTTAIPLLKGTRFLPPPRSFWTVLGLRTPKLGGGCSKKGEVTAPRARDNFLAFLWF